MAVKLSSSPLSLPRWLPPRLLFIPLATLLILVLFISPLPHNIDDKINQAIDKAKSFAPHPEPWQPLELDQVESKYAFATFLAGEADAKDDDPYFVAARLLTYQLLYAKETKSRKSTIPFVILVTHNVPESHRDRLRKDGAIIVPVDAIDSDWAASMQENYRDVLTKLRLWELTQFERICFLDGDTVLTQPMDGVFSDPAVELQHTLDRPEAVKDDEAKMPSTYAFATFNEMEMDHGWPPSEDNNDFAGDNHYFNVGFFVYKPSHEMLKYYLSLLAIPDRFPTGLPEQNLLNYAHREDGTMPWKRVEYYWNVHMPLPADLEGGVRSLHNKWWNPDHDELSKYMESWRYKMEGYFEALDDARNMS